MVSEISLKIIICVFKIGFASKLSPIYWDAKTSLFKVHYGRKLNLKCLSVKSTRIFLAIYFLFELINYIYIVNFSLTNESIFERSLFSVVGIFLTITLTTQLWLVFFSEEICYSWNTLLMFESKIRKLSADLVVHTIPFNIMLSKCRCMCKI